MSTQHAAPSEHAHHVEHTQSFVDRWWPLGLILFGATFVGTLVFFHPHF